MALWRITNTFFTGLINRLGVRPPPRDGFALIDTIQPVTLVDADISLGAVDTTPLFDVGQFFSAGETAVPGAGTRLATTGAQVAGNYTMVMSISINEAASIRIRRRNAADTADVWAIRVQVGQGSGNPTYRDSWRFTLAANEFVVVENVNAGGAGSVYHAVLILVPS